MATREVGNNLREQRQYRKARNRSEGDDRGQNFSVKKRRKMDPVFVEKWDAAALKVRVLRYTSSRPFFCAGFEEQRIKNCGNETVSYQFRRESRSCITFSSVKLCQFGSCLTLCAKLCIFSLFTQYNLK